MLMPNPIYHKKLLVEMTYISMSKFVTMMAPNGSRSVGRIEKPWKVYDNGKTDTSAVYFRQQT